MFTSRLAIAAFVAVLSFAGQASAAPAIAVDPVSACGLPNNGDHHAGSSCKFYAGPSTNSPVLSGKCVDKDGTLTCIPT